jgi:hypothetical protein
MIPSLIIQCEYDPDLVVSTMYIEIPKKTFEDDMHCVFGLKPQQAYDYFQKMYRKCTESKNTTHLKNDPHYKALRGLVRNVWFRSFQVTFQKPSDDEKVDILPFYSNDYFYIISLPTRMLPSTVSELYQELLEKEKLEHEKNRLLRNEQHLQTDFENLFGRMNVLLPDEKATIIQ